MKINILMVVYNSMISDTALVNSALTTGLTSMYRIIADNSTDLLIKSRNQAECERLGICYVDMKGNVGLSKAYNRVISQLSKEETDVLIIFDQDTIVGTEYFDAIIKSLEEYPDISIHVPIVRNATKIMSPRKFSGTKIISWDGSINEVQSNLACINSGSAIKLSVFRDIGRFDENLFLDMVDYDFYKNVSRNNLSIKVVDVTLQQQFSGDTYSTLASDLTRFSIYSKDYSYFAKKNGIRILQTRIVLLKRALKLSAHYHTIAFLKVLENLELRRKT